MQSTTMPPHKTTAVYDGNVEFGEVGSITVDVIRLDEDRLGIQISLFMGNDGKYLIVDGEAASAIADAITKAERELASYSQQ